MANFNKQLDEQLFNPWMSNATEEEKKGFCRDGLLIMPDHAEDFVDELWEKSSRRVMFLVKDKNTPYGDDIRRWFVDQKNGKGNWTLTGEKMKTGFSPNIANIFYGLQMDQPGDEGRINNEYVVKHKEEVLRVWNSCPIALVEAKKQAGVSHVASSAVTAAMEKDKDLLRKELEILHPNIIVCCDANDSQFNFLTQQLFADKKVERKYDTPYLYNGKKAMKCPELWYYSEEKLVIIKSYHPTNGGKQQWWISERVFSPFHKFLTDYPEALSALQDKE